MTDEARHNNMGINVHMIVCLALTLCHITRDGKTKGHNKYTTKTYINNETTCRDSQM